ncbi:MAG: DUF1385 domain-containing protein [Actinomycetota bacterium]|nr:DUF1385 domain-containing protein [Actinomycetota bacterium]
MPSSEHFYGGQAVLEGVMMRGRDHWAIAVRKPNQSLHVESHQINTIAKRWPIFRKAGLRGVIALGQALSIGVRALTISANQSAENEQKATPQQMAVSMVLAFLLFTALFIAGPFLGFRLLRGVVPSTVVRNVLEGFLRLGLFLGYLALIGRMKEIRRVFQYHGAEHKTIAAFENGDDLTTRSVDRHSTLHVRCGTNFLLIVMVLTIPVYSIFTVAGLLWGLLLRLIAIPVIAGISYEMLRLGAKFRDSLIMRALMAPGLWLQKITTRPPDDSQIEVAITAFNELLKREGKVAPANP